MQSITTLQTIIAVVVAAAVADGWNIDSALDRRGTSRDALFFQPGCGIRRASFPTVRVHACGRRGDVHMRGSSGTGEPNEVMKKCVLCGRDIPSHLLSKHHLVPRLKGGKTVDENLVSMHRSCHDKVHAVFTEGQLARDYHTVELLLADPDISKFVSWIKKRPIDFSDSTMSLRRRKQRKQRR